jgi:cell division protease FtsH
MKKEPPPPNFNIRNIAVWGLIIALFLVMITVTQGNFNSPADDNKMNFSQFTQQVKQGNIASAKIDQDSRVVTGKQSDGSEYVANIPFLEDKAGDLLEGTNIPYEYAEKKEASIIGSLLMSILPLLLIVGVFFLFFRSMQGGGRGGAMSFGKSKAKLVTENAQRKTVEDGAGVESAKEDLKEVVEFLQDPSRFTRLGARIPTGALLVGPPGTGKTLLARAVAGEAGVPFFTISGSDFVEMFVGVGASRVREMFADARKHAPCIIFIDEIDAVGRHRGVGTSGGHE